MTSFSFGEGVGTLYGIPRRTSAHGYCRGPLPMTNRMQDRPLSGWQVVRKVQCATA